MASLSETGSVASPCMVVRFARRGYHTFPERRSRSNTFSIRTRRPSFVSYHSCCRTACFRLRIRCRIRVPVAVSISTSLGNPDHPSMHEPLLRRLRTFPSGLSSSGSPSSPTVPLRYAGSTRNRENMAGCPERALFIAYPEILGYIYLLTEHLHSQVSTDDEVGLLWILWA